MITDKIWKLIPDSTRALNLARELDISRVTAKLLINRGISDSASAKSFLAPALSNLSDPMLLADMDKALDLITHAVKTHKSIVVYGDYDADGLTASALLLIFFNELGIPASAYIPNRLAEGYGLNSKAIKDIARDGGELIITVDCGISNREEIELAHGLGLKIIITDHHQIPEGFVPACPVINPHRTDSAFPYKELAGVGVAFFLLIGIRAALRDTGWFRETQEPDLRHYLDLVALGTVADMTPLTGLNRILVAYGIEVMKKSKWPGIKAIQDISGIQASSLSASDLAFKIAPRLNAPGRMGDSMIGLEALMEKRISFAMEIVALLNSLNSKRQSIESNILSQIEDVLMPEVDVDNRRSLVLYKEGWHQGVLGIVASKLLDKYHRPTIVLTIKNGMATGSGRSIDGFNLYEALAGQSSLFEKFGGHYHAAGLTLKTSNLDKFSTCIEELARKALKDQDLIPVIKIDDEIEIHDLTKGLMIEIESLAPFGSGNPEPLFLSRKVQVLSSRIAGERHLKLILRQGNNFLEAIGFGLADMHPLEGESVDVVFTPEINRWNGQDKIQLRIADIEVTEKNKKLQLTHQGADIKPMDI
jgi:single-stranded-DNA-specific exonuclease